MPEVFGDQLFGDITSGESIAMAVNEPMRLFDSLWCVKSFSRRVVEALSVSDGSVRILLLLINKVVAESVRLSEIVGTLVNKNIKQVIAEIEQLYDSVLRTVLWRRVVDAGIVRMLENSRRIRVLRRYPMAETMFIFDGFILWRALKLSKMVGETLDVVDAVSRWAGLLIRKIIAESERLSDSLLRIKGACKMTIETLSLPDFLARLRSMYRIKTEAVNMPDSSASAWYRNYLRAVTETLRLNELVPIWRRFYFRAVAESGRISEALADSWYRNLSRALMEAMQLLDAALRPRALRRLLVEVIALLEFPWRAVAWRKALKESVSMLDAARARLLMKRVIAEAEHVADVSARWIGRLFNWYVVELLAVVEQTRGVKGFVPVINEAVRIVEGVASRFWQYAPLITARRRTY